MHYKIEPRDEVSCWLSVASMPSAVPSRDTFPVPADLLVSKMRELLIDPDLPELSFEVNGRTINIARRRDTLRVETGGPAILDMRWPDVFPLVLAE